MLFFATSMEPATRRLSTLRMKSPTHTPPRAAGPVVVWHVWGIFQDKAGASGRGRSPRETVARTICSNVCHVETIRPAAQTECIVISFLWRALVGASSTAHLPTPWTCASHGRGDGEGGGAPLTKHQPNAHFRLMLEDSHLAVACCGAGVRRRRPCAAVSVSHCCVKGKNKKGRPVAGVRTQCCVTRHVHCGPRRAFWHSPRRGGPGVSEPHTPSFWSRRHEVSVWKHPTPPNRTDKVHLVVHELDRCIAVSRSSQHSVLTGAA